jgi:hypothetical protein
LRESGGYAQRVRDYLRGLSDYPPPELQIYRMMEQTEFRFLPYEGGLCDQPAVLWERLMICREEILKDRKRQELLGKKLESLPQ